MLANDGLILTCESIFEEKFYSGESFQLSQAFAHPERFGTKMQKRQAFYKAKKIKEEKNTKVIIPLHNLRNRKINTVSRMHFYLIYIFHSFRACYK